MSSYSLRVLDKVMREEAPVTNCWPTKISKILRGHARAIEHTSKSMIVKFFVHDKGERDYDMLQQSKQRSALWNGSGRAASETL